MVKDPKPPESEIVYLLTRKVTPRTARRYSPLWLRSRPSCYLHLGWLRWYHYMTSPANVFTQTGLATVGL
jgi:hypothetical protein